MSSDLQHLTAYCKAAADQQRLQILRILSRESFGVLELCQIVDAAQPAVSHHLKILSNADLVETRRQGTSIYYRRALVNVTDPIRALRQSLFDAVDELTLDSAIETRIGNVYQTRHEQAKAYFEKNAHRFMENQDLITEYNHYSESISDLLNNETIDKAASVIEVGPGESDLILDLAHRYGQVIAIDNTAEMLEKTKQKIEQSGHTNVEFLSGELKDYNGKTQLIALNMVLHHLASPAQFFKEAAGHLEENGRLLIADLCAHDQDWTRETCGDLWQGFDPGELDSWATAAGFQQGQSAFLGLNNGFQVQVRIFQKLN